jgi:acyl-CoA hydrolase
VTATVEEISLRSSQLSLDEEMRMSGRVVWTGKSSIDIRMELEQVRPGGAVLQLYQLLVTVQGQGHACVHAVASFSSFHSLLDLNRASLTVHNSGRRFLI